jgi:hypothetical protein
VQQEISNGQEDSVNNRVFTLKACLSEKKNSASMLFADIATRLSNEYGFSSTIEVQ